MGRPKTCGLCGGITVRHCKSPTCTWARCACGGYGDDRHWTIRPDKPSPSP